MALFSQYGNAQRAGFALVCIGFCLCVVGSIPPNWVKGEVKGKLLSFLSEFSSLIGNIDLELLKVRAGIWIYCVDSVLLDDEKCFNLYDPNDRDPVQEYYNDKFAWINVARGAVVVSGFLSFLSMLIACCRTMCCSGGRTLCHGVLAFLAGACAFVAVGVVASHADSLLNFPLMESGFDWAFAVYVLGSASLVTASLLLCWGVPKEVHMGMMVANPNPAGINVQVAQTSVNQYNAAPVQFEPLPYPSHHAQAPPSYPLDQLK